MNSCLITAPSYSELSNIFTIRSIYKPENVKLNAEQEFTLNRRFAQGIEKFRKIPFIENILQRVGNYNEKLKALGIKDEDVPYIYKRKFHDVLSIVKSFSLLCFNAAFVTI